MAKLMNRDEKLKNSGEKEISGLTKQRMFGIVKDFNRKIDGIEPADTFLGHQTTKVLEESWREAELQKSAAIVHLSRLQIRLI